jgi:hypothetical protein
VLLGSEFGEPKLEDVWGLHFKRVAEASRSYVDRFTPHLVS